LKSQIIGVVMVFENSEKIATAIKIYGINFMDLKNVVLSINTLLLLSGD
tara:strand:+ start:246 stop:392 length:147 start_codon:yes stop_codon:yes gene_type:complete